MPLPPSLHSLQELRDEFAEGIIPNSQEKSDIDKGTCMHGEKYCRLTASNLGDVVKCRPAHSNFITKLDFTIHHLGNKVG